MVSAQNEERSISLRGDGEQWYMPVLECKVKVEFEAKNEWDGFTEVQRGVAAYVRERAAEMEWNWTRQKNGKCRGNNEV